MNLLLGVGMFAAAAVLFAWAYGKTRSPAPSRWTRKDSAMIPITLVFTTLFTLGIGFLATGLLNIGREVVELGATGAVAVALMAGAGTLLSRRLASHHGGLRPQAGGLRAPVAETAPAKAA